MVELIQYKMALFERGYVITNGPMRDSETVYKDKCLPIRLTVLECEKNWQDTTIANIILDDDGWGTEERPISKYFQNADIYQKILSGNSPEWFLYSFEVSSQSLSLDFYNPKRKCSDYIILFAEDDFHFKIQFDLLCKDGETRVSYLASAYSPKHPTGKTYNNDSTATVIKHYQGTYQERLFTREGTETDGGDYMYVTEYVTEYADS